MLVLAAVVLILFVVPSGTNEESPASNNTFNLKTDAVPDEPGSSALDTGDSGFDDDYEPSVDDSLAYKPEYHPPEGEEIDMSNAVDYQTGLIDFSLLRKTEADKNGLPVFPRELLRLEGRTVHVVGFMTPYDSLDQMNNFMLFPYPVGCFFCAPPSVTKVLLVRQARKGKAPFVEEPILVKGTLSLWSKDSTDPGHAEQFLYVLDSADITVYRPGTALR